METQPKIWQRLKSEIIADCRVFNVRRDLSIDPEGNQHNFYVLENPAWVNVIPMTKSGEVVLIEQYRHGIDEITLEIPGGMVDEDEDVLVWKMNGNPRSSSQARLKASCVLPVPGSPVSKSGIPNCKATLTASRKGSEAR